ncbi:hypothetical protein LMG24238_07248 [Paraburkholderia sediminicola]|uniref:Uncharacterized protein n=1 Tax=Paraburkholderia sediminicola TaxID=458836 RepID=A0A6J5CRJ9_9BURK|nr:hypothetical protein LMG24238_07248 [Paraburkholderia sediminicola]
MADEINRWKVGNVKITRVVEMEGGFTELKFKVLGRPSRPQVDSPAYTAPARRSW